MPFERGFAPVVGWRHRRSLFSSSFEYFAFFHLRFLRQLLVQVEGQILFMKPLFAEIEKLDFAGEVLADDLLGGLRDRGLVDVPVDLGEDVHFICEKRKTFN